MPVVKRIPVTFRARVAWKAGRVAIAKAWSRWYWVAVVQSRLILSSFFVKRWAPTAPEARNPDEVCVLRPSGESYAAVTASTKWVFQ